MCGRFTLATPPEIVAAFFELDELPQVPPRYNIAPTQDVACVLLLPETGRRALRNMRWGLIPTGTKETTGGNSMINARAETIRSKPAFRDAFRHRRCLVVADGFYEWKNLGWGKQPYYIRMRDNVPLAFAGLWEHAKSLQGGANATCTIITSEPNDLVRDLHDRMPVILDPSDFATWLDCRHSDLEALQRMLRSFPAERLQAYPVSPRVNSPDHDGPACIDPVERQQDLGFSH
jgi:putative SOS response-associated peptidase YedK